MYWKYAKGEKANIWAVGNGILWLTPCKLAVRAQLGERSKYSSERRRRSVVIASMVSTITDPLRGSPSLWHYLQAALIRSYGASFACMELTIISRFQRLPVSTIFSAHTLFNTKGTVLMVCISFNILLFNRRKVGWGIVDIFLWNFYWWVGEIL